MSAASEWAGLLDADETILWQGAPTGRFRLEFEGLFSIAFMIVWTAIPLFALIMQPASLLLGVPALFLGIGLWFFVGQHFYAMWKRRRTFYTLSSARAFIATRGWRRRSLQSYPITPETVLDLEDFSGGGVWFAVAEGRRAFSNNTPQRVGFDQLENPREVYAIMRQVQKGQQ